MATPGLFCALDFADETSAWNFYRRIRPAQDHFKVGLELFSSAGPDFVRRLVDDGAKVFLDLKLHDIPNTVGKTLAAIAKLQVGWTTVHILGGEEMLRAGREALGPPTQSSLRILGVTVLTSMNQASLRAVNVERELESHVLDLATKGKSWGCDGVICSPLELKILRAQLPPPFLAVVPGIRLSADSHHNPTKDDQARVATPEFAARQGANFIVVGRPILQAPDPVAVVRSILASLEIGP